MPKHLNCLKQAITKGSLSLNAETIQQGMETDQHKQQLFLEQHVVLFMLDGMLCFRHGEQCLVITSGEYIFLRKDILVECESGPGCNNFLIFVLQNELISEFASIATLTNNLPASTAAVLTGCTRGAIASNIHSLRCFFQSDDVIPRNLAKIKSLELLFSFAATNPAILGHLLNHNKTFQSDITYVVEQNLTEPLSLQQLARLAGRSISSFRREFISIYNMPPFRWMREKKLEKARQLLLNTNMSVTTICYTMGFENTAHFSRIFKSKYGYPPSNLRIKIDRAQQEIAGGLNVRSLPVQTH